MRLGKERSAIREKTSFPHLRSPRRAAILMLGCWFAFGSPVRAQDAGPTEYQIKAAFLYNFVKFVDWPTQAYVGPTSPAVIGVLGENVFGDNLAKTIHNKVIHHHPLQFKQFDSVAEVTNCQVLFISASERNRFPQILAALRGKSILTVSESGRFIPAGGMINFILVNRKVRFQINNLAARQAGLSISSDLLNLAVPAG
ncbi:MAG TPA: YfiR family protein [Verrucomicrobiae bacterium]|nr:YfiR family protein [Verrucomicrobiae bacterium]